jgi:hypothetical protein
VSPIDIQVAQPMCPKHVKRSRAISPGECFTRGRIRVGQEPDLTVFNGGVSVLGQLAVDALRNIPLTAGKDLG